MTAASVRAFYSSPLILFRHVQEVFLGYHSSRILRRWEDRSHDVDTKVQRPFYTLNLGILDLSSFLSFRVSVQSSRSGTIIILLLKLIIHS